MPLAKVNVVGVELDEPLDEAGFRHVATAVGERLGARRIGAGVYRAEAGVPIWPYHYHHGVEEWLYVIDGAPVLREPAGERALAPGDVVCFPSGHLGAHTVAGPGRFVIFSTGQHAGPWLSVYPDSDKISAPGGILLRSSAVGYWHGEGTAGPSGPVEPRREPEGGPPRPVANVGDGPAELGPVLGAEMLAGTVAELAPGETSSEPYHYVHGQEAWLLVLAGTPALRHPGGEDLLAAGDLVCLPEGPAGAREVLNRGDAPARTLLLSTTDLPANAHHPETGRWVLRHGADDVTVAGIPGGPHFLVRQARGPEWDPSLGRREQAGWDEHAAFVDRLAEEGRIVLAGPVGDVDGEHAVLLVRAAGEAEARAMFDGDPWTDRILRIDGVEPWTLWIGGPPAGS